MSTKDFKEVGVMRIFALKVVTEMVCKENIGQQEVISVLV